ncbi:caspase domain-containing protein [Bradyrhizobium sp. TZ2]
MGRWFFRALRSFVCFAILLLGIDPGMAGDRVALIIGNGRYQKVPALPNPPQDAADIARALERLDFKVTRLDNASAAEMRKSLVEFGRRADGSDVALVFYAGHGMEVGGENWLIPVDAELQNDTDIESEAVSLRSVTLQVAKARSLGLIILDACRNNPFANKMRRSLGHRAVDRGLARTEPTDNVLVAYAARDGTTASDGTGRNSPFTTAILRHIETPGLEISFLFRRVRDDVMTSTKREQQPFVYGSLSKEEIYLKPPIAATEKVAAPKIAREDEEFWEAIKTSDVGGLFEEFIRRYRNSPRVGEARQRLASLSSQQLTSTSEAADQTKSFQPGTEPRNAPSREDEARIAALAAELKFKMPGFTMGELKPDVPQSVRRFVGIWVNKNGYEGGGRRAMLIVTDAASNGAVAGYYVWGPPTKSSWVQDEPGYSKITGQITDGELEVLFATIKITARLDGRSRLMVRLKTTHGREKTGTGRFSGVWQLEKGSAAETSQKGRNGSVEKRATSKPDPKSQTQDRKPTKNAASNNSQQTICGPGGCRPVPKGCHVVSGNPAKPWTGGSSYQSVVCN